MYHMCRSGVENYSNGLGLDKITELSFSLSFRFPLKKKDNIYVSNNDLQVALRSQEFGVTFEYPTTSFKFIGIVCNNYMLRSSNGAATTTSSKHFVALT